jgi:hypothetical protein
MPTLIDNILTKCQELLTEFVRRTPALNIDELSPQGISELTGGILTAVIEAGRHGLERHIQSFDAASCEGLLAAGTHVRRATGERSFLTLLGPVKLDRSLLDAKGGRGPASVPLDEAWGMSDRYETPDVAEAVLFAAVELTPADTCEFLEKFANFRPSREHIHRVINSEGARLREHVEQPANRGRLHTQQGAGPGGAEVFVAGADGVNLAVREPGKKQGRPNRRPGAGTTPDGQKKSSFKNAMVGSFSTYKSVPVAGDQGGVPGLAPQRLGSTYTAKMPEERFPAFKAEFEQVLEVIEGTLPEGIRKLFICDGGRNLWKWARETAQLESYEWLLDFYHMGEHLARAAEAIFGADKDAADRWYARWCHKLKHEDGAVGKLLRSMRAYAGRAGRSKARAAELVKQRVYFERYGDFMGYAAYVREGLPIATGPLEAACKMLVKQRLCRAGMRWSSEGGANVLNLRVLKKSNMWHTAWKSYYQQEILGGAEQSCKLAA